jgi:hypothetical protein
MKNDYEYNKRFIAYQNEIDSLKKKNAELESLNRNLQMKLLELSKTRNYLIQVENNNKFLAEDQINKINRIKDLENEVLKVTENSKEEHRLLQKDLEAEILYYKGLNKTGLSKIDAAEKVIKLNETQHNFILKLEEKIDQINKENEIKMSQLQIEHERHYLKLKKQMMDFIKKAQDDMTKNNEGNLELNTKFGILYKNQMLNELENQSLQIRELLKIKERHERQIFLLKQEIATHKAVEHIIGKKKDKYLELAKIKIDENIDKEKSSKELATKVPLLDIKTNIFNNNCLTERNSYNHKIFRKMSKKDYYDYKSLEKIYKELLDDYRFLKNKYNTLKDKERIYQEKYKGIIYLYNEALEELLKDEDIKNKENIYVNLKEFNKENYENLTKEEKYYILVALINNILPLVHICEDDKELSQLKEKINNVEFNRTQMTKFSETSRHQTIYKPFIGYNMSTNEDSNLISSDRQQFVSLFGDDYIEYGKSIFSETNSVRKEKNNYQKFIKNKIKNENINRKMNEKRNLGLFVKSNTYIGSNDEKLDGFRKKIENDVKDINKNISYKRDNSCNRKLVRVLAV